MIVFYVNYQILSYNHHYWQRLIKQTTVYEIYCREMIINCRIRQRSDMSRFSHIDKKSIDLPKTSSVMQTKLHYFSWLTRLL